MPGHCNLVSFENSEVSSQRGTHCPGRLGEEGEGGRERQRERRREGNPSPLLRLSAGTARQDHSGHWKLTLPGKGFGLLKLGGGFPQTSPKEGICLLTDFSFLLR